MAFDPLKAAVLRNREGDYDEALWLVFLATHFGRHRQDKWKLCADIYGQLGGRQSLTWHRASSSPDEFRKWLQANEGRLRGEGHHRFGNHRKYESISASSARGTASVVESYIAWVGANRGHSLHFKEIVGIEIDRYKAFDALYQAAGHVLSFGRTGRFDYLTLAGNLELLPIEPGIPYLQGATGPLSGAKLLFIGSKEAAISTGELSDLVVHLGAHANLGMQVLEDSLCNWQKSPSKFEPFRG